MGPGAGAASTRIREGLEARRPAPPPRLVPQPAAPPEGQVTIAGATASDLPAWQEFVTAAPHGTFCHLPGWSRVVERTFRHRPCHLVARRGDRVAGVLPLFHVRSRLFGSSLVSTPNAVYGGAVAEGDDVARSLLAAAKRLAVEYNVKYLELRDAFDEPASAGDGELQTKHLYATFEHPISPDEEAVLKSLPRDLRRMIRQGVKHGLSATVGREDLLGDFYEVYAASLHHLGTPVFPKRLFAELLAEFPAASDILVVRAEGRVASAVMSFYFRDSVMPYYGGAYQEFYKAGVNNFMYWELMRRAAARGFTRFDFGRSKVGTGAYHFKHGWGMTERPLPYRYFLVRATSVPDLSPLNPKFDLMIRAWKRLPLKVTKVLGPLVVRKLA